MTAMTKTRSGSLVESLNTKWHEVALWVFMVVVILHWGEHIMQAIQIWLMDLPRPEALGALGYFAPWLVKSEVMHFTYAVVMFGGLVLLRPGFSGRSRKWWNASTALQGWHLLEHTLLFGQAVVGINLFGSPVPTSLLQPFIPRAELHLLYNFVVFVPMVVAMWIHSRGHEGESIGCTCGEPSERDVRHLRQATVG